MPSSAIWTWCGAWGSNPPDPACRAGALPESELRILWGGRESNTGRAPYQRAQVRPYRPAPGPRGVLPARETSVDHRGIEPSPQALIRRRRSTRSLWSAVRGQGIEPVRYLGVGQAPSPAGSPRVSPSCICHVVEVAGFEPTIPASRTRCLSQIRPHLDGRDGGNRTLAVSLMRAASRPGPSRCIGASAGSRTRLASFGGLLLEPPEQRLYGLPAPS